jgi:hypothetical protein
VILASMSLPPFQLCRDVSRQPESIVLGNSPFVLLRTRQARFYELSSASVRRFLLADQKEPNEPFSLTTIELVSTPDRAGAILR